MPDPDSLYRAGVDNKGKHLTHIAVDWSLLQK